FDFSGDDRWYYDREDAPWAASEAEVEQLWKQSVRNDWLRLKLAGKDPDAIRRRSTSATPTSARPCSSSTAPTRSAASSTPTPRRSTRIPTTSTRAAPSASTRACHCRSR